MPDHYKKYAPGSEGYKKAYAEHMMNKLKKKRKPERKPDYNNQVESSER